MVTWTDPIPEDEKCPMCNLAARPASSAPGRAGRMPSRRRPKGEPASKCWTCTGTGTEIVWLSVNGKTVTTEIKCTDCGGTGEKQ
jgi:hypothetical protein